MQGETAGEAIAVRASEPALSPEEAAHSAALLARLRQVIADSGGAITFPTFMEMALYAPGLGYYSAGARKLGPAGDFTTAPELTPLFARCLARTVAEALTELGGGDLLEIGPGSGALMVELAGELVRLGTPPRRLLLLERSADLRERQAAALAAAGLEAQWLDALPPAGFVGVIVGNELLDAMPAACFRIAPEGPVERLVGVDGDSLAWREGAPVTPGLAAALEAIAHDLESPLPVGYCSEVCLAAPAWLASIAERMQRGVMVLADYGYPRREYYHPQRADGTLRAHHRHRAHGDPLRLVGLQDISVHVDFTAVARAGAAAGLELAGFTTQAGFLLAAGLTDALADILAQAGPDSPDYLRAAGAAKRLVLPGEMGESVKVVAFARGVPAPRTGFGGRDLRGRLGV
ncbi:MAG: SAM-dependent methyltransferase [Ectothiorhodospiraceae bacterium]|nr:SAM-dependent methyltransferase [Ectothiorhodospiraceae bacterium]